MIVSKDEIDTFLKKAKIGDRGYFNKEDGKEYCVANKIHNPIGRYKNFVYLVSIDYINDLENALKEEMGLMLNANWIFKEYDLDKLFQSKEKSREKLNFNKYHIDQMYEYIHKNGNIYEGLAYLYSVCKEDEELNKYIMTKINYDTNNNSLNSERLYAMQIIARNNFENKYKELLGDYTMFTVDKESLELEEKAIQKYPQLNYNTNLKTFELEVDDDKIDKFFITYRCYPQNIIKQLENRLFNEYGIPVTVGDENIEQIQKEMGELGVSIYQKYYDWYKENGMYEYTDYIDSFCYGKIEEIKDYLDEVIDFTEDNDEISKENKIGIINQAKEFKNKLDEYERTKEEEVEINE